tara:strand:+ start:30 stop:743 length:714 start_codon:yes stop_codon:yes gene_type:complete
MTYSCIDNYIPIFIGYDYRERAATNILIDSIYQNSSCPVSFTPIILNQLKSERLFYRRRDPKQSTDFSFSRFLVPKLMNYEGWAIFMDCDMLCKHDIKELWNLRDDKFSVMCVKHEHKPIENVKFQGELQTTYQKKNWSSLLLFNCNKCKSLTVDYVNTATGLDLHRFKWLSGDKEIGALPEEWNYLVDSQEKEVSKTAKLIHWTLGGPWFRDQLCMGAQLAAEWYRCRDDAMKLWD